MDRVRLGRALGFGARAAAKTLVQAADAAMSPNPNATSQPGPTQQPTAARPASAPRTGNVVAASKRAGRSIMEPVKRHSRELWLEVTGSFFALLALTMAGGMWALHITVRTAFQHVRSNPAALWSIDLFKFYVATAAFLMFAYYAVSNFLRVGRDKSR